MLFYDFKNNIFRCFPLSQHFPDLSYLPIFLFSFFLSPLNKMKIEIKTN